MHTVILAVEGFGINANIFETNLINLAIVLVLVVNFARSFLGKLLSARLQRIEAEIREAEARQKQAQQELEVAQANLAQAQAQAQQILQEAQVTAESVRQSILAGVEADIAKLQSAAEQEIASEQERVLKQLRRQLVEQAISAVQARLEQGLSDSVQQQLVDRSLSLLSR